MRRKKPQKKGAASELQQGAQTAIAAMQLAVDEDGCDVALQSVISGGRIAGAFYKVMHDEDHQKHYDDGKALFTKMTAWLSAQKEGKQPWVAYVASAALAEDLADFILHGGSKEAAIRSTAPTEQPAQQPNSETKQKLNEVLALLQTAAFSAGDCSTDHLRDRMKNIIAVITTFLWRKKAA